LRIDEDRALAFAAELDPHPFHLDGPPIFGGLTASGWRWSMHMVFLLSHLSIT
jgi:acyl dehydratase